MYNVLPPQLHDRYSMHVRDKVLEKKFIGECPTTKKLTRTYFPITVHAIKD